MSIKSFGLTHVQYDTNDSYGSILALFSLTPIFIIIMFTTLIVFRRDFQTIFSVIGQMICVGINLILKHLIKQPRPIFHEQYNMNMNMNNNINTNDNVNVLESEYGMPSNHAQFICHFSTYYSMQFLLKCWSLPFIYRLNYTICLIGLATITSYSRFHLHYHTMEQVLIGCVVGCISGFIWYILSNSTNIMSKVICRQEWAKWIGLRDYSVGIGYSPIDEYHAMNTHQNQRIQRNKSN